VHTISFSLPTSAASTQSSPLSSCLLHIQILSRANDLHYPPPTLIDGEKEYEVETILDSWMRYNRLEYLVKWKGYDESHNQWEEYT
jgi:hypothetical protein